MGRRPGEFQTPGTSKIEDKSMRKAIKKIIDRRAFGPWRVRSWTSSLFSLSFRRCSFDFLSIIPWISFFVVLVLGFRVLLFLGTDQARHTRGAPGPIPPQTTPLGFRRIPSDPVGDGNTLCDRSLKIAFVFDPFFFVFRSIFGSKMPPKIDPKTFKNHFQNRFRF